MNRIGQRLGNYEITSMLSIGGMSEVYKAFQPSTGRDVVVKVMRPFAKNESQFLKRFQREMKIIATLSHPHILKLFDYGEQDGTAYVVLEWLKGGSLADLLQKASLQTA